MPLRLCLADAHRRGLVAGGPVKALVLSRRRGGNGRHFVPGRFLTRDQLRRLLAQIPEGGRRSSTRRDLRLCRVSPPAARRRP